MLHDIRYAARILLRSPGFAATTVATLALSVALSTALFAVIDAVFFRPLAVRAPGELVYLYWTPGLLRPPRPTGFPRADFEYFRETPEAFSGVAGHWIWHARMTMGEVAESVSGELVTANYFEVLGIRPLLGRTFVPDEDREGNLDLAIVIGHDLWVRRFQANPDVVGKSVLFADSLSAPREATVIGVVPQDFVGVTNPWTPSQYWITFAQGTGPWYPRVAVAPIARLETGVTLQQAQVIVSTKGRQLNRDRRQKDTYLVASARTVRMPFDPSAAVAPARLTVSMLLVVGVVLVVTTANVSGVMSARGMGRATEIFVRRAVGATAMRVGLQLTIEGVLPALIAGVLGLVVAGWLVDLFHHHTPARFAVPVSLNARASLFAAVLCLTVGVIISLGPALQGIRAGLVDPTRHTHDEAERITRRMLRSGLLLLQVTLATLLVLVAATHLLALLKVERRSLGYDPRGVISLGVTLRSASGHQTTASTQDSERQAQRARTFYRTLLLRTHGMPGVRTVALSNGVPVRALDGGAYYFALSADAFRVGDTSGPSVETLTVSPNYFETIRLRVLAGRDFDERDTPQSTKVAIVSEALASQLWPGRDPIARSLAVLSPSGALPPGIEWLQVVGVVNEVTPLLQERGSAPFVYLPMGQQWSPSVAHVLARVDGSAVDAAQRLKEAVEGADAVADVDRIQTLGQMLADILYSRRLAAAVLGASATIAIALALVGLYAVVSYSVSRRVRELGIRAALGAGRSAIVWLVAREAIATAALGSGLGVALAYVAVGVTAGFFEGMPPLNIFVASTMPILLTGLVALAAYVPARRAARIDPMEALRAL